MFITSSPGHGTPEYKHHTALTCHCAASNHHTDIASSHDEIPTIWPEFDCHAYANKEEDQIEDDDGNEAYHVDRHSLLKGAK